MLQKIITIIFILAIFSNSLAYATEFVRTQILMENVPVTITIRTQKNKKLRAYQAMSSAFEKASEIEEKVSEFKKTSELLQVNQRASRECVIIGDDLKKIILKSLEISKQTNGAFDITFASSNKKVNYADIAVLSKGKSSCVQFKKRGMKLGVSGIAKGYIVDQMADVLIQNGFKQFLVNAGDIYAKGKWKVTIRDPFNLQNTLCTLELKNQAISTSGNYERGFHIMNPQTKKVALYHASVTVIAPQTILSDALATAFFTLEKKSLLEVIKNFKFRTIIIVVSLNKKLHCFYHNNDIQFSLKERGFYGCCSPYFGSP